MQQYCKGTQSRKYHSYPNAAYFLPSDDVEKDRLLQQHLLFKAAFEGKLIIPQVSLVSGDEILDSGTGSAIWLLDVLQSGIVPNSVRLHGIDIEAGLFPTDCPSQISLNVGSVASLPPEWTNKFSLVNQRLLVCALTQTQWPIALREIRRVLVPGGWVQLVEIDTWNVGPVTERLIGLMRNLAASKELVLHCASQIPRMLAELEFVDIETRKVQVPLDDAAGTRARDNLLSVFRGMKTPVLKAGGFGYVTCEEELDALIDSAKKELEETLGGWQSFVVICGRKAA